MAHTEYYLTIFGTVCTHADWFQTSHCIALDPNFDQPLVDDTPVIVAALFKSDEAQALWDAIPTNSYLGDALRNQAVKPPFVTALHGYGVTPNDTVFDVSDKLIARNKAMRFEIH